MNDLFEKEQTALDRARAYLAGLDEKALNSDCGEYDSSCREELLRLTNAYAEVLRQLRWVVRISDLTTGGLNSDKAALLDKVNIDLLTECYNRRFLTAGENQELESLAGSGAPLTVIMADIDNFKDYNDIYGHSAGDRCLKKVAAALRASVSGAGDFVVRYGGEEFLAVLPGVQRGLAQQVAERIRKKVFDLEIPHANSSTSDRVTVSLGVTTAVPKEGADIETFINRADEALYQSKRNGKNKVTFFEL